VQPVTVQVTIKGELVLPKREQFTTPETLVRDAEVHDD
jgi:hypothetical protein